MIGKDIEATYPAGQTLPEPLRALCAFLDEHGYPLSGCFELSTIGLEDLNHWFKKTPHATEEFLPFGRGACGDVYAIWLTEQRTPQDAPVVIFGSEGELKALAVTSLEFCRLLCFGYSELGLEDHTGPGEEFEEARPLRDFMIQRYGFELPENGAVIIDEAQKQFPGFKAWVEERAWD